MAKISFISQNYSPIGATCKTPSLIPENIPTKTYKMAKKCNKIGNKTRENCQKLQKKMPKMTMKH